MEEFKARAMSVIDIYFENWYISISHRYERVSV
jgi:hypothetical protein